MFAPSNFKVLPLARAMPFAVKDSFRFFMVRVTDTSEINCKTLMGSATLLSMVMFLLGIVTVWSAWPAMLIRTTAFVAA